MSETKPESGGPGRDILVVGSVAIDSIITPDGHAADDILGGAAVHFALAASLFAPVHLVGAVGDDLPEAFRDVLGEHDIDTDGLVTIAGQPTFRWKGRYHQDPNKRDTLALDLGAFEAWEPKVPEHLRQVPYAFCATIDPKIQRRILEELRGAQFTMLDTIDHWITNGREDLVGALGAVNGVLINDEEARQLTSQQNLISAARQIGRMGPHHVVVKKGEHGALLYGMADDGSGGEIYPLPAYWIEDVVDPTGAGDSFAGGFMGSLSENCKGERKVTLEDIRRAVAYGTVLASFNVQGIGTDRVRRLKREEVDARYAQLVGAVTIPG